MTLMIKHPLKWHFLGALENHEKVKLFGLLLMKLCLSFTYTILHATKDTLIVTAQGGGAEAIPILKGGIVLLCSFVFMICYTKLSNHLSKQTLFYVTIIPFIVFFLLYAFLIYPNRETLMPTTSADWILSKIGAHRTHYLVIYRCWMHTAFFLMAELWGSVVIVLLFWGFANQISNLKEAARFYFLIAAGGHIGIILAGPLIWKIANGNASHFELSIKILLTLAALSGVIVVFIYRYLSKINPVEERMVLFRHSPPKKLSLLESLTHLVRSPHLKWIALMVIGYSLSVNMIEVPWKATLRIYHPNPNDYEAFMGVVSSFTGVISLFLTLFIGTFMMKKYGWFISAVSTPLVLGLTSLIFLTGYFFNANQGLLVHNKWLFLLVMTGAIHNVACKSMKYCLFDPTKEMSYIPLDEEEKTKGKAVVDLVGSRFGKSGSSWIQAMILELTNSSSILACTSFLAPFILFSIGWWIYSVYALEQRLFKKVKIIS